MLSTVPECLKQSGCVNPPDSEAELFYWFQETNFAKMWVYPSSQWPTDTTNQRDINRHVKILYYFTCLLLTLLCHKNMLWYWKYIPHAKMFTQTPLTRMRLEPSSSISRPTRWSKLAMLLILLWRRKSFFSRVNWSKPSTFLKMLKDTSSCLLMSQSNVHVRMKCGLSVQ